MVAVFAMRGLAASRVSRSVDVREEFRAQGAVSLISVLDMSTDGHLSYLVHTGVRRRGCHSSLLLHASHHHTHVSAFNNYGNSTWFYNARYSISNLVCEAFLNLEPSREHLGYSGEFAEPQYLFVCKVADMHLSEDVTRRASQVCSREPFP